MNEAYFEWYAFDIKVVCILIATCIYKAGLPKSFVYFFYRLIKLLQNKEKFYCILYSNTKKKK